MTERVYSPSQLGMYLRCPAQWRFRYAEGLKMPPSGALVVGTALHTAAETNARQKIATHIDLPESDLADAAASAFEQRVAAEGLLPDPDANPGELKDTAVMLTRTYAREVAPTYQPAEVERPFRLSFDSVGYTFAGRVDVTDDAGRIRDLKSKGRTPTEVEASERLQLSAYALAHEAEHGKLPPTCVVDSVIKLKEPKAVSHTFEPTLADTRLVQTTLAEVHAGVTAGAFPPNRASFTCSRRQCGYAAMCEHRYGGRVRD